MNVWRHGGDLGEPGTRCSTCAAAPRTDRHHVPDVDPMRWQELRFVWTATNASNARCPAPVRRAWCASCRFARWPWCRPGGWSMTILTAW